MKYLTKDQVTNAPSARPFDSNPGKDSTEASFQHYTTIGKMMTRIMENEPLSRCPTDRPADRYSTCKPDRNHDLESCRSRCGVHSDLLTAFIPLYSVCHTGIGEPVGIFLHRHIAEVLPQIRSLDIQERLLRTIDSSDSRIGKQHLILPVYALASDRLTTR